MMTTSTVTPREWMRQWLAMLDRQHPHWGEVYDREALELSVADLMGDEESMVIDAAELDVMGEFTINHQTEAERMIERGGDPLDSVLDRYERAFRITEGSSLIDPALRDRRCEAMKDLIQALQQPMARRVRQIGHAMEMRERRRRKRHPLWGETDLVADRRSVMPEAEALGREAAERVTRRAGKELSPAAMGAIRRYLLDPSSGPACDVATDAGISPATMTRALKRLRSISAEELKGCREAILKPFSAALLDRLRAA